MEIDGRELRHSVVRFPSERDREERIVVSKENNLFYLTITTYLNRFILVPRIEQMQRFAERQASTAREKDNKGDDEHFTTVEQMQRNPLNLPSNPVDMNDA